MSDDLVKQSIAELQEIVHCDCGSAYLERGRHSHSCLHYMADVLKIVTDRIEELEAKLAKAVEALGFYATLIGEKHECPWHMLSDDFGEKARAALAELGDRDMCKNFTELREGEG